MNNTLILALLFLAPLIGFLVNGFNFKSKNYKIAGAIGTGMIAFSFVMAIMLVLRLIALPEEGRQIIVEFFSWITVGDFKTSFSFLIDPISAIMILIITGVGTLIHIFSIGYMSHDERPAKYFSYLNLFIFNMALLVLGDNLLVTFIGWEGVGLCSYLLIGFWFNDAEKAAAGMKAFITNRVGDAALLLGIFILFFNFGTVNYLELATAMPGTAETGFSGPIALACLLLFIGATGKSAQIPLYVWLPDAMAGPTPVSALIHAATMVTAGVYMIVRLSHVYVLAPSVMSVIAVIGALTAFFAALIGMTQWDIKKVLAYSTVSQLGYMFLGVGVGAFIPAMFHLMTHAFFKALMFLGSGSVIHAMSDEQDMRKMGALRKMMPITHLTFLIGWLAIIGLPPFSGFFSKDEILWYSFNSGAGHWSLWLIGAIAAGFTAFYMTRLMCLTFWGKSRVSSDVHPHESPALMTIPLIILSILAATAGFLGIPHVISAVLPGHPHNILEEWLSGSVAKVAMSHGSTSVELGLMGISVGLALISAFIAYQFYVKKPHSNDGFVKIFKKPYEIINNKFYVDEFYFGYIIDPLVEISKGLWTYVDVNFIDKISAMAAQFVESSGQGIRKLQNGDVQFYAMYMLVGVFVFIYFALIY